MADSPKTGSDELGEAVRQARERLGMSRRDLAESTGLSYPYISQIETGYRMPSTPAMRSLADALGLRPNSLFDAFAPMTGRDAAAGRAAVPTPVPPESAGSVPSSRAPSGPGSAVALTGGPVPAAPGYVPRGTGGPTTLPPSPASPNVAAEREGPAASEVGTGVHAPSFSTVGRASGRPSAAGGSPRPASAGSPAVPIGRIDGADRAAGGADLAAGGGASAHSQAVGAPMEPTSVPPRTGSDAGDAPANPAPARPAPTGAQTNPAPAPAGAPVSPSPASARTDLAAGAGGSWITNRSFRSVGSRAAAPPTTTARHDRAIDHATGLLTSLPTEERLPALAEVQARVVRSIIDDAVGRDGGH